MSAEAVGGFSYETIVHPRVELMNEAQTTQSVGFPEEQRRRSRFSGRLFAALSIAAALAFSVQCLVNIGDRHLLAWAAAALLPAILYLFASLAESARAARFVVPLHLLSLLGAMTLASRYAVIFLADGEGGRLDPAVGALVLAAALFATLAFSGGVGRCYALVTMLPLLVLTVLLILGSAQWKRVVSQLGSIWLFAAAGVAMALVRERSFRSEYDTRALSLARRAELEREVSTARELNDRLRSTIAELEREVEERRTTSAELEKRAAIDDLTGVYNRRAGMEVLQQSIYLAQRNTQPLTLSFIDVDDLKTVNDNYGHSEGDVLLRRVVTVLKRHLRKSDYVCRLGGDEFLVVLPNCKRESARAIMERIEEDLGAERRARRAYRIQISTGFAEFSREHEITIEQLLKEADIDMYRAKQRKKLGGKR